ncbi:MAG: DUF3006 domain-containing protein [Atopobiaceae bacterium]|jgi:hypothetical protein|nr:DUF3006 domain-containing protein [Atopobiaceae bacterium]MCI1317851.1 DUF3006 domain-containing protein [Atopobiaceae bacterium]MCI1389706.1 DUF3006 domain-containing protein [Atopobiaceae bacterium]MCI1431892.1 DUF3006 domain-containing protein [Atopobiaceae bacterium]MCI1470328.1 DUF3006 domain-containing protein [Atopobiaceae bacterium]
MQAIVDRIEGKVAVLELDGSSFEDVPLSELPAGIRQGDVLEGRPGSWRLDDDARRERLGHNADLMRGLFRRP